MLPAAVRMRRSTEFDAVVRRGMRARRGTLVVHQSTDLAPNVVKIGLIVGKAVGNSVVRHRVSRRLRAQLAQRLSQLPGTSATVVRALPAAGEADSSTLGADLDAALQRLATSRKPR